MKFDAAVFDFDLTLADSLPAFYACHEHAATALGLSPPARLAVGRNIGTPLPLAFRNLYGVDHEAMAADYIRLYQHHADQVMTDLTVMLPGASEAIESLHHAGLRLGILSQKLRYRIEAVLEREDLISRFVTILGAEEIPDFKPDPRGLLTAMDQLDSTPSSVVFVGDTVIDAETARRAGVAFVAVLSGFTMPEEFANYPAIAVIDSVSELPVLLAE